MQTARYSTVAFLGFMSLGALGAQTTSSLPATPSTAASLPAPISATSVGTRETSIRHRARITYVGGLLSVGADNSSLNGILRDVAQATGMKLTGGVADQRVFGNYGPAVPATVLATLLDGTGTNMLLRETADNGPRELILTPRTGGATPPSPNSQNYDGDSENSDEAPPAAQQQAAPVEQAAPTRANPGQRQFGPQSIPQPINNVLGSPDNTTQTPSTMPTYQSVPTDAISTPSVAPPVSGIVDSTNPPPAGSTTLGSSTSTNVNGGADGVAAGTAAKTPEQIYQQLQQMRQQSQQSQQPATSPSTTPQ